MTEIKRPQQPKDRIKSREWAIAPLSSVGVSATAGVSMALFDLTNRMTHRSHRFEIKSATIGYSVKMGKLDDYKDLISQSAGTLSDEEYSNFTTTKNANFDTFDGCGATIKTISAVIYSKTWLTLYDGTEVLARVNMSGFGLAFPGADAGASLSTTVYFGSGRALGKPDLLVNDIIPRSIEDLNIRSYATERADSIVVVFPSALLFEFNEFTLRREIGPLLDALAVYIQTKSSSAYPRVYVVGHTDSKGSNQYNDELSRRRALRVYDYLQIKMPNKEFALRTWVPIGRGMKSPIAPNKKDGKDYPEGRSRNRRVEVILLAPDAPIPNL